MRLRCGDRDAANPQALALSQMAIDAHESERKDFDTKKACEKALQSMQNAIDRTYDRVNREQFCHTAPEFAGEEVNMRVCRTKGQPMEEVPSGQTHRDMSCVP